MSMSRIPQYSFVSIQTHLEKHNNEKYYEEKPFHLPNFIHSSTLLDSLSKAFSSHGGNFVCSYSAERKALIAPLLPEHKLTTLP